MCTVQTSLLLLFIIQNIAGGQALCYPESMNENSLNSLYSNRKRFCFFLFMNKYWDCCISLQVKCIAFVAGNWKGVQCLSFLRDSVTRFFGSGFFHESVSPKPLSIQVGPFRIFSKIRGDIRNSRLTTGINDTGGKFSTGINDTGGKFCHQFH